SVNQGSKRAFHVHVVHNGRHKIFESWTEYLVFLGITSFPHLADFVEQPAPIDFIDADGRKKRHWLDALVTLRSGERIGVA
ncbi:hypothetical protein ABTK03_21690, partial [Acinetobacter baumannii]